MAAGENDINDAPAAVYSLPSSDFHNIQPDSIGPGASNSPSSGYDPQTGLGTPVASSIISGLAAPAVSGSSSDTTNSAPQSPGSKPSASLPPTNPAPLDDNVDGGTEDLPSGPGPGSSPAADEATNVSPAPGSTDIAQVRSFAVTLASSAGANASASMLTPAQSSATSNVQSPIGPTASNESNRGDPALRLTGGSIALARGPEIDPQLDSQQGQQDGGSNPLGADQFHLNWPDAHRNIMARAKHAGSSVAAPVLLAKRHEAEPEDGADSLSAIDHCFASGTWIERILSAHPDADLPPQFGDPATIAAAIADEAAPDYAIWSTGDGDLSADQLGLAAAIAVGAYWQMSRRSVSDVSEGTAGKSCSDFLSLTSRFREAKLAWASATRTTKPR